MYFNGSAPLIEVQAPAKINLFLEVLGRRGDGFHEVETVLASVSCYDTLFFSPRDDGRIELDCRHGLGHAAGLQRPADLPPTRQNLIWKAVELLRVQSGLSKGATIRLVKRIPSEAGLGGASSDAAATLLAANCAWKLNWPREKLAEAAAELGSDVPFFVLAKTAVCRGRGERIEAAGGRNFWMVVVKPFEGLSTAEVYRRCRPADSPRPAEATVQALASGRLSELARSTFNRLEAAAAEMLPQVAETAGRLAAAGAAGSSMSGSGSSCFGLARSRRHARRIARRLSAQRRGRALFARSLKDTRGH